MQLVLIHLGSWGGDAGRPRQEQCGDMLVRDVSYYGRCSLLDIIDREQPAAVIFLSVDVFAHRAFNRYCRYKRVPTLHLYHGLVKVQATDKDEQYKVNFANQLRFVLERVPKAFTKVWPAYMRALLKTGATAAEWRRFAADIFNLARGKYIPLAARDARTTRCAVYTDADVQHAMTKYGFKRHEVMTVGNPDLAMFGVGQEAIASALHAKKLTDILYIDTGLIYAGMVFCDADDFLKHLIHTKEELQKQGRRLAIKLHPQHYRTNFPERLREVGVEVVENDIFLKKLKSCAAAICEPSTAALVPAMVGVPLLLARYGKLSRQQYGEALAAYPRARYLDDVRNLNSLLLDEQAAFDQQELEAWIKENAGPLPSEKMPERVAELMVEMIEPPPALCGEDVRQLLRAGG